VFALTSACALEEDEIRRAARDAGGLHVVGGAYSRTGLATALAADELGIRMIVIAAACFSPAEDKTERGLLMEIGGDAARAENSRAAYEGTNVICLESWRP
jgi:cysteine synthase